MPKMTKKDIDAVSFISLCSVGGDENGAYRGGALLTDGQGKPLEFRCTSVIRPNHIQEILYGKRTLWPHVCIELVARPLHAALEKKPDVIVVNDENFLGLRELLNIPLFIAVRHGDVAGTERDDGKQSPGQVLSDPDGKFAPVFVTSHVQHNEDLKTFDLQKLSSFVDLTEPFSRVKAALEAVHKQKLDN